MSKITALSAMFNDKAGPFYTYVAEGARASVAGFNIDRIAGLILGGALSAVESHQPHEIAHVIGFYRAYIAAGGEDTDEAIYAAAARFADQLDDDGNLVKAANEVPTEGVAEEARAEEHGCFEVTI